VKSNVAVYTGLALFAGAGGLELGLKLALGEHYRTVAYVEREASSAAVLATNMERPESGLDKGVIWDDVTSFTGDVISPFVDRIDIMSAGFPCQPWSVAGARKGTEDERWLWPHIFRLVREIRPRNIFLENVPGLLHGGIEHVLGDLASVGFDAQWISLRASSVSAPHRRERVFILGNSRGTRSQIGEVHAGPVTGQGSAPVANTGSVLGQDPQPGRTQGRESSDAAGASGALAHADNAGSPSPGSGANRIGSKEDEGRAEQPQLESTGSGEQLGNAHGKGLEGRDRPEREGAYERPPWPPGPEGDWSDVPKELWPATEPPLRGVVDGLPDLVDLAQLYRTERLRALGNAVVPAQAEHAIRLLLERVRIS